MVITFIAHAGISIEEDGYSILIDPWFLDSTVGAPVIESIGSTMKTIDFQIPRTNEDIEQYAPDAILISHFHPHHSPRRDIEILCANSIKLKKTPTLFYPRPSDRMEERLVQVTPRELKRQEMVEGESTTIGPFTIEAKGHTVPFHNAWSVRTSAGSILHIADGRLNRDKTVRLPDSVWQGLATSAPTALFISVGGHSIRTVAADGTKIIGDAEAFTSVEAAQIVNLIKPKAVGIIGVYNHSIWKNRDEYILPATLAIEQFQWAMSWLSPETLYIPLVPGYAIHVGSPQREGSGVLHL